MNILQVSTRDIEGGAERVAWNLFRGYRQAGHGSWLAVGGVRGDDPDVHLIPNEAERRRPPWPRLCLAGADALRPWHGRLRGSWRVSQWLTQWAEPRRSWNRWRGGEDFYQPGTRHLLKLPPAAPDILHLHNLHGGYFDLRDLPRLSARVPTLITLHDAWLLSGHCAHSFDCERWRTGCGACPDLSIYPAIRRDRTAANWRLKAELYARSRLALSSPSQWLMDKIQASMLMTGAVETRVIPYGVDLSIFQPGSQVAARASLNLPPDALILLFSAASIRANPFKDYPTMQAALAQLADYPRRVILLALGESAPLERLSERVEIWFMPFQKDLSAIARFYQAADVYLHAARADTFPNAVLEALACGRPVVASAVGGIPEQVRDGVSGWLVSAGDVAGLAGAIRRLLDSPDERGRFGAAAAADARQRFDLRDQIQAHLAWYEQLQQAPPKA